jgi:hypothetical protein
MCSTTNGVPAWQVVLTPRSTCPVTVTRSPTRMLVTAPTSRYGRPAAVRRRRHVPSVAARLALPVSVTARLVPLVGIGAVGILAVGVTDPLEVLLGWGVVVLDPVLLVLPASG